MSDSERITKVLEFSGLKATKFADYIGINTVQTIYDIKKGKHGISKDLADKIQAKYLNINIEWLLTGKGSMLKNEHLEAAEELSIETRPRIPMAVAAGTLTGFADGIYEKDCEQIPVIKALPTYDYTMIVKGDSMEPKFEGGDEIAIRKVNNVIEWGQCYVLDTRDGAVLKRLYDEGDFYLCVSYNKEYPDFKVNKNDVFGVYKVVGLIRI